MAEELTTAQKAKPTNLQALIDLANRTKAKIAAAAADATAAIKSVEVKDGSILLYTNATKTGDAAFTVDFPKELVLDQLKTEFKLGFKFADGSYGDATDPDLDGKPVLVVAVKGSEKGKTDTTSYSFIDFSALVDTYKAKTGDSAKILNISGYEIEVKISAAAGNIIEVKDDGLYVTNRVSGATENNLAAFDENGAPKDSGIAKDNVLTTASIATPAEVKAALDSVFGEEESGS